MKLVTIVGTRPEIIRLSCFIEKADKYFNHILVHTNQNFDKNLKNIFFDEMKIRQPDYCLNVVGNNLGETMGNIISKSFDLLKNIKPDAVLVLGDTNSGLSVISAKRLMIPVFHYESGNRSFSELLPEEINRRIIDHTSDINLCYSENARRNLLREGLQSDRVFVIGSPMREIYNYYLNEINASDILKKLQIEKRQYIVLSVHRENNVDKNFDILYNTLVKIIEQYHLPIIFGCHPRTRKIIESSGIVLNNKIVLCEPFGFFDYNYLEANALFVLSDSGSLYEMAAIAQFPAVSLREETERQEVIDKGNCVLTGSLTSDAVLKSIEIAINEPTTECPQEYNDCNVSAKLIKIIQAYTPIINKNVWKKIE